MPPVIDARPLRWLIVAPLSCAPTGRRIGVSGQRFTAVMAALPLELSVTVPDRLGDARTRTVKFHPHRPRDFRTREVLAQVELLGALNGLADTLQDGGALKSSIAKVRALVGDGPLCETLELILAVSEDGDGSGQPAAARAPRRMPTPDDNPDDEHDPIFGKASVSAPGNITARKAKSAVGSFISAIRTNAANVNKKPSGPNAAAEAIRVAVQSTAREILDAEPVAGLERAWRSLRMIVAAAPRADDLAIDALDVGADAMVEAIATHLDHDEPFARPDAIFVIGPVADPAVLAALATTADEARVPIVVPVEGPSVGLGDGGRGEDLDAIPEAWQALRDHPSAGWLCAVMGEPVLANEAEGDARVVTGGGAAAVAAMAAASVGTTAAPGDIVGKRGALVAPAAHDVEIRGGRHTIPTRTFVSYRTQKALAGRGVVALGSEIDSDQLRLAAAPMVGGSMALPGRILAGRAHRLAVEIRRQLGGSASTAELARALDDAAGVFLPHVCVGDVTLRVSDAEGPDAMAVDASIGAVLAGAAVKFSSKL